MSKHAPNRTSVVVAIVCTMVLATCSLRACSSDNGGDDPVGADAGADVKQDVKQTDGGFDAAAEDGSKPPLDSAYDSETWQPAGDPGWKPLEWAADCGVEVASTPSNAVPSLIWTDCGPGCRRMIPNWSHAPAYPLDGAQVYKQGSMVRLSLHAYFDEGWRKAIWDENMQPLVAWRGAFAACSSMLLQWTADHVCFSLAGGGKSMDALLPTTDPSGAPLQVYKGGVVPRTCNSSLWAGISLGGTPFVRDLSTGQGYPLSVPGGEGTDLRLSGNTAFFIAYGFADMGEWATGWSWKPPNTLKLIVDGGSEMVFDIRSDGTTLAWVQTNATQIEQFAPGWLWTSPHTTEPDALVPSKRRAVPPIGPGDKTKAIGAGYYALIDQGSGKENQFVNVYRLSDGHHWIVNTPDDVRAATIIAIDAEEVWILGMTPKGAWNTVIRQRIDALGAGD